MHTHAVQHLPRLLRPPFLGPERHVGHETVMDQLGSRLSVRRQRLSVVFSTKGHFEGRFYSSVI